MGNEEAGGKRIARKTGKRYALHAQDEHELLVIFGKSELLAEL